MGNAESSASPEEEPERGEYRVRCHCGSISARFQCDKKHVVAWNCNCSDCYMRQNIHIIVPETHFRLDMSQNRFNAATTDYKWGTGTAKRRFCSKCGVLPWYRPRSNPDGYGVKLHCVDWGQGEKPEVEIRNFDGQNWESSYSATGISALSKAP